MNHGQPRAPFARLLALQETKATRQWYSYPLIRILSSRLRRLQCDLRRTVCGQCKRANLVCSGFRDPGQLIIRDETSATRWKYSDGPWTDKDVTLSLGSELRLAPEVQARFAFFAHYVFGLSRSYDVLLPLYQSAPADGYLSAGVDAASAAFLAFQEYTPQMLRLAKERYLAAARLLRRALERPEAMASDTTLQTVLLLDLFEKLVNSAPKSSSLWMSHVRGGVALIKARGFGQFPSYASRRLAARLYVTVIISAAAANARVPDGIEELGRNLAGHLPNIDPKWLVTGLVVKVVNLRASIADGDLSGGDIIASTQEIDLEFQELERGLPPGWEFIRVSVEYDLPGELGIHYDQYRDHFVTQVRNVIRTMRLLLQHTILKHRRELCDEADTNFGLEEEDQVTDSLCREICSSAPQFVWPGFRFTNMSPFSTLQMLQCYTLLGPLYLAGQLHSNPKVRQWIIGVMRYMAEVGGMRRAQQVADILENSPDVSYWDVYTMLGSYALAA